MNALAIDSSSSAITFAAVNGGRAASNTQGVSSAHGSPAVNEQGASTASAQGTSTAILTLDIDMHQSEKLLEGMESVLSHCGLQAADLDFTALCAGPGTFTGLRLAFSALKALNLAYGIPTYAIPTLEVIAYPYRQWCGAVIPVLDAKKQSFYTAVYRSGELNCGPFDCPAADILKHTDPEEEILAAGADAAFFAEQARALSPERRITTFLPCKSGTDGILSGSSAHAGITVLSLLEAAAQKFIKKEKPLEEYEGPFYIRKSEAELSLAEKTGKNA
ncbi:MAG: tRNA (adenosine(37)-N6)-threonylcarbamoyltransferase complex dimerization subunit type 1 TsaB [Treponema sp.]|uniref:tRNA (adenosine(37)-N6)-threonylcarbamoyltransferase complex dimerization subunit type 1 TsaB n=1 Tax=Treponema sp. TaxID=166 RepID=UPI003FA22F36